MASGDIIDEIGQALRNRGFGELLEEALQCPGRASGVQRVSDRTLAHAVHHGRSRRFHDRHGPQFVGKLTLQRTGHHDRQIGLDEEVVDGIGEDGGHGGRRGFSTIGQ